MDRSIRWSVSSTCRSLVCPCNGIASNGPNGHGLLQGGREREGKQPARHYADTDDGAEDDRNTVATAPLDEGGVCFRSDSNKSSGGS